MGAEAIKSVRRSLGIWRDQTDHTLERTVAHFLYALHWEEETKAKPSRKSK
jgi:hypothetical protein